MSLVIERLIEDLRNRERCLHAEAEVYMQSQIRTIGLEKENAEIELASVSSFCDSAELILNKTEPTNVNNTNEVTMTKKQCKTFSEQMSSLDEQHGAASLDNINRVSLVISDLNDLSEYIKSFGLLTVANNSATARRHSNSPPALVENTNQFLSNRRNANTNASNTTSNILNGQRQPRQTWNTNQADLDNLLPYYYENNNENTPRRQRQSPPSSETQGRTRAAHQTNSNHDRPIFGGGGEPPANRSSNNLAMLG